MSSKEILPTFKKEVSVLLKKLKQGEISYSFYDTAWLAYIPSEEDGNRPMFLECLDNIKNNQHLDGSWGAPGLPYYYDRIICTLMCIIALKKWNTSLDKIKRAESFIQKNIKRIKNEEYPTVGFELIFPELLEKAKAMNLNLPYKDKVIQSINQRKDRKLKILPPSLLYKKPTTLLHSLEAFGNKVNCHKLLRYQSKNGSFLNSPSSTAFVYLKTKDGKCLDYLKGIVKKFNGHAPVNYPIDIFEKLWMINKLYEKGLNKLFAAEIEVVIKYIEEWWDPQRGIPWSKYVQIPDLDDTSVAFKMLLLNGFDVSVEVFKQFFNGKTFFCFQGELEASPSHLLNLLDALSHAKQSSLKDQFVGSCISQLELVLANQGRMIDKWNLDFRYLRSKLEITSIYSREIFDIAQMPPKKINTFDSFNWLDKCRYELPLLKELDSKIEILEQSAGILLPQVESRILSQVIIKDSKNLHAKMSDWSDQYSLGLADKLLSSLVETSFYILPGKSFDLVREIFVKEALFHFLVDDYLDKKPESFSEVDIVVQKLIERISTNSTALNSSVEDSPILSRLTFIFSDIEKLIINTSVGDKELNEWKKFVIESILAMHKEQLQIRGEINFSVSSYLNVAQKSICVFPMMTAVLVALGEASTVLHDEKLSNIFRRAEICLRFANDAGTTTFLKELEEGKENIVTLLLKTKKFGKITRNKNSREKVVKNQVYRIIDHNYYLLKKEMLMYDGVSYLFKTILSRLVDYHLLLYKVGDHRDFDKVI